MKPVMLLLLGFLLLTVCACEEAGFVDKDKYDKVVQENADLKKQLAQKEEELKNIPRHHYSLHNEGFRTFRFDADTGETCILLAPQSDWKKPEVQLQNCASQ